MEIKIQQEKQLIHQSERMIDFNDLEVESISQKCQKVLDINPSDTNSLITLGFIQVKYYQRVKQAEAIFNKVLEINEDDVDAYLGLCECLLLFFSSKNNKKIQEYLDKCLQLKSDYWRVYYYQSYFFFQKDENQKAYDTLLQTIKLNENEIQLKSLKKFADFFIHKDEKLFLSEIEELIRIDSTNNRIHKVRKAYILKESNQIQESEQTYQEILSLQPWNFNCLLNLMNIYKQLENKDKLREIQERLIKYFPENSYVIQRVGDFEEEIEKKLMYYDQSLQLDPNNSSVMIDISDVYFDQKKYEESLLSYQKATEIDSENDYALSRIGYIYDIFYNNLEESIKYYLYSLKIENDITTLQKLTDLFTRTNQHEKAIEYYEKCQEIEPEKEKQYQIQINISKIEMNNNNDDAFNLCKQFILQDLEEHVYHDQLRTILANDDKYIQPALQFLQELNNQNPRKAPILESLGRLYTFELSNYKIAVQYFNEQLEIDPDDGVVQFYLGLVNLYLGEFEISEFYLQNAVKLDIDMDLKKASFSLLNIIYKQQQNYDKWMESNELEQNYFPGNLQNYQSLSQELIEKQHYNQAIQTYNKMLEINNEEYDLYKKLGQAYQLISDYEKSQEYYLLYIEKSKKDLDLHSYLQMGKNQISLQNINQAFEYLDKAFYLYNRSVDKVDCHDELRFYYGMCFYERKEYKKAMIYFKKCLLVNSCYREAQKQICQIEINERNYKESLQILIQMLRQENRINEDMEQLLQQIIDSGYQDEDLCDFCEELEEIKNNVQNDDLFDILQD